MPRHLISDAHEWINEIPTVPIYSLSKVERVVVAKVPEFDRNYHISIVPLRFNQKLKMTRLFRDAKIGSELGKHSVTSL